MPPSALAAGILLAVAAFLVRIAVHWGRAPGGVDTWYHLAYARALRRKRRLDAPLPQYLLQDERQSYPPLFPMFLALLPERWLDRWFWVISPVLDVLQLIVLYSLCYRITQSLPVAVVAASIYVFTPQLVSEVRSLNARSFAALLHSIAVLTCLRYAMSAAEWPWLPLAVLAAVAVFLASATATCAYGVVMSVLALRFQDLRFLLVPAVAFPLALILSRGHLLRVIGNYLHAAVYCARNRGRFGSHPVRDSPIYGLGRERAPKERGFLGRNTGTQLLRLLGENPFLLALPLAAVGSPWTRALHIWAVCLAVFAVSATVIPFLRVLGPGRSFIKLGVFPIAYVLAVSIGGPGGFARPVGIITVLGLLGSVGSIVVFVWYVRTREAQTVSVPEGLAEAARALRELPDGGVFCLPDVFADYTCYHSGKPVLWGGHCGDLRRFEWIAPVISRPVPELIRECGVKYLLVDVRFATPAEIGLGGAAELRGSWGAMHLYEVGRDADL